MASPDATLDRTPQPAPDVRALGDRLVGTWQVTDPTGEGAVDGRVVFEWLEGGFFLVQRVDLIQAGHAARGIEVIGHERPFGGETGADVVSRFYSADGDTLDYVYDLEGDTLTIWGGGRGSPAHFRGTFDPSGDTLTGAWVWPGGGYSARLVRTAR